MTLDELLALPHVAIERKRLLHLVAEEGYMICNYYEADADSSIEEAMDMKDYWSMPAMYLPIKDNYTHICIVTKEEDAAYSKQREEAYKADGDLG